MCGIAGMFGAGCDRGRLERMVASQAHRGPDDQGSYFSPRGTAGLGHNRLSIIDLSSAGRQPMCDATGRYWIVFNGEIYNYLELREEMKNSYAFRNRTDTEILLAAYLSWGEACLDRLVGMFAFVIWDEQEQRLFGARDRFGVKPFHFCVSPSGGLWLASEIKGLHAAGCPRHPDVQTWAQYLAFGTYDHSERTFWRGIRRLAPGACLTWNVREGLRERQWYDAATAALGIGLDRREEEVVGDQLLGLLEESVNLRFRSDVPVGICLSGGFDSSLLLALVNRTRGPESSLKSFTFFCGNPDYDETPWVERMLRDSHHQACFCRLAAEEVPRLAETVQKYQDEPFGGIPTLGMAKVHERAKAEGVTVLLDGNGLDEGWAGYEYYRRPPEGGTVHGPVQGARTRSTRPECLRREFRETTMPAAIPTPFSDGLRDLQYRDIRYLKIPRAMRFADRVSMMYSRELREPFLDHRILELGLRQPLERKIFNGEGKWLLRHIAATLLPTEVREAPKRPVQTPQREWLRGPLATWAEGCIEDALAGIGHDLLDPARVRSEWCAYLEQGSDNSFPIWQWVSLGLMSRNATALS